MVSDGVASQRTVHGTFNTKMLTKLVNDNDRYGLLTIGERHHLMWELLSDVDVGNPEFDAKVLPEVGVHTKGRARASIDHSGCLHVKLVCSRAKVPAKKAGRGGPARGGAGGVEGHGERKSARKK